MKFSCKQGITDSVFEKIVLDVQKMTQGGGQSHQQRCRSEVTAITKAKCDGLNGTDRRKGDMQEVSSTRVGVQLEMLGQGRVTVNSECKVSAFIRLFEKKGRGLGLKNVSFQRC